MRLDILTIFPEYLAALDLSLVGKAKDSGLITLAVHDLRDWTDDPHRTVDDSPFGGGAGMVMRPDIWGKALDDVLGGPATSQTISAPTTASAATHLERGVTGRTVLAFPTPSGRPLTQKMASDLATADRLVIACGRYEGIDARVAEHYEDRGVEVLEYSIGDFVLNGGEVAALALVEAVARLIPGVVGNPESLVEESHGEAGLLEYPIYTRPASWRELDVPGVLTSGNHALIARWRRDQAIARTAARRPDMLARVPWNPGDREALARAGLILVAGSLEPVTVRLAIPDDVPSVASLARQTFPLAAPPDLSADDLAGFIAENLTDEHFAQYVASDRHLVIVAEVAGEIAGYTLSVLPATVNEPPYAGDVAVIVPERPCAELSKIYVREELLSSGLASALMDATLRELQAERVAGQPVAAVWLGTNARNKRAQKFYKKWGFEKRGKRTFKVGGRDMNDAVWVRLLVE